MIKAALFYLTKESGLTHKIVRIFLTFAQNS